MRYAECSLCSMSANINLSFCTAENDARFTRCQRRVDPALRHARHAGQSNLIFCRTTADRSQPWRIARTLVLPAVALVLAFGALYYLEHYRDPNYVGHRAEGIVGSLSN